MVNIEIIKIQNPADGTITEHIIIDRGNGEFTSMLKSTYDAMQAARAKPVLLPAPPAEEPVDPTI